MATQDDDQLGLVLGLLFGMILLVISLVFGVGLYQKNRGALAASTAVASAAAATTGDGAAGADGGGATTSAGAVAAGHVGDGASVRVEEGVVKFYFASGKAELAEGAAEALGDIVRGVAAGKTAVISGFHDATGDAAVNEELAKQRALAVRDALAALGIGEDKLELRKPAATTADGSNAEARRVEVTLE